MGLLTSGVASAIGAGLSIYNTNSANKHAKRAAEQQRAYETEMSNTAHQREMADLKAAGINPLFTATGGNGATTPNSAVANVFRADDPDMIGAVNSATKKNEQEQGERLIDSTIDKNKAEVAIDQASVANQTRDSLEYQKTQQAQRNLLKAEEDESRSRTMLNNNQWNENSATSYGRVEAVNAENRKNKGDAEFQDSSAYRWNEVLSNSAQSYASAFRDVGVGVGAARGVPGNYSKTSYHYDGKGRPIGYSEERTRRR